MPEFDSAKRKSVTEAFVESAEADFAAIPPTDVMTGNRDRSRHLYYQLQRSMRVAVRIDILVSFLMESGVRIILDDLRMALKRGAEVRILTGNYLGITQPSALCLIKKELGDRVDLRFFHDRGQSFHPKAYIFHYGNAGDVFIGSSNLSRSALTSGVEWNYRLSSRIDLENFEAFCFTFEDLFVQHSIVINDEELRRYSKEWHRPALAKDLDRYDAFAEEETEQHLKSLFQPRGAQIEALYALENSRAEGAVKGLVQAATGVGKTYLAAFDSAPYERVLFVAHREEILAQAARTFSNVRGADGIGYFDRNRKDTDKPVLFASVATLGKSKYLTDAYFAKNAFDYIVLDEFHHAVTDMYRRIVEYFKPKFLLGLTATPERMDGRDIYELCDYNVPYEISLKEAINKGLLVPFHYYGIYDETDYSGLHLVRGRYDENELYDIYRDNANRYELIYRHYKKHPSKRALGFCCSRAHAEEMAKQFCARGIPSVAVYSDAHGAYSEERDAALRKLRTMEIKVIFCVDIFNEGVDIKSLDMVMFLRPTESPIVFLQQLGRGLRTSRGKEYLTVLDFIGNYAKAGRATFLLSGENASGTDSAGGTADPSGVEYPDDCLVDFDLKLIDLFEEMERRSRTYREQIRGEFYRVKDLLGGRVPTRMEFFSYMEDVVYEYCVKHAKENPFRHYLDFLHEQGELDEEETQLYGGIGREFLNVIETTDMVRVYKMPVLYSFYNHGNIRMAVTNEELLEAWKAFFDTGTNWKDFSSDMTYEDYKNMSDKRHLSKAKTMPIRFLKQSGKGFFVEKEGYAIAIRQEMREWIGKPAFVKHMGDILEYRTMEYYRRRYRRELVELME